MSVIDQIMSISGYKWMVGVKLSLVMGRGETAHGWL